MTQQSPLIIATAAGLYILLVACIAEIFGTAILLWGILASGDAKNMGLKDNLGVLIIGGTVLAVGLSRWTERLFYQPSS